VKQYGRLSYPQLGFLSRTKRDTKKFR